MKAFVVFALTAVGTYAIRLSGIVFLGGGRALPPRVARALRLVAPAAMGAIIANSLLLTDGQWRPMGAWHIAAAVAIGVSVWRRSTGLTMAAGAAVFAALLIAGA